MIRPSLTNCGDYSVFAQKATHLRHYKKIHNPHVLKYAVVVNFSVPCIRATF